MATTKIPFRTAYSGNIEHYNQTGDGTIIEYGYEYNGKNQKVLQETGKKDLYSEIQSYHDECKIETILSRVAIGDMSNFRPDGIYADTTKIPKNLIEAQKQIHKAQTLWDNLPLDVRKKYDNNFDSFLSDVGSDAWLINTGLVQPKNPVTPEAKAPETKVETPQTTE